MWNLSEIVSVRAECEMKLVICMFLLFPILQAIRIRRLNSQTRIQVIHQNESSSTVPAPLARPHGAGGVYDC